jgi:hypothetical protein
MEKFKYRGPWNLPLRSITIFPALLKKDLLTPVKPSDECSPIQYQTTMWRELRPRTTQPSCCWTHDLWKVCVIINIYYCLKPLGFGVICHASINNKYTRGRCSAVWFIPPLLRVETCLLSPQACYFLEGTLDNTHTVLEQLSLAMCYLGNLLGTGPLRGHGICTISFSDLLKFFVVCKGYTTLSTWHSEICNSKSFLKEWEKMSRTHLWI